MIKWWLHLICRVLVLLDCCIIKVVDLILECSQLIMQTVLCFWFLIFVLIFFSFFFIVVLFLHIFSFFQAVHIILIILFFVEFITIKFIRLLFKIFPIRFVKISAKFSKVFDVIRSEWISEFLFHLVVISEHLIWLLKQVFLFAHFSDPKPPSDLFL